MTEAARGNDRACLREAVVDAAARLLRESGSAAVTTRRVAEAAGVQAPTIYRLFGDKDGLLDAVAEHVMTTFVRAKTSHAAAASLEHVDPVDDLRAGWDTTIDFGLANPALFALLSDPDRAASSPAARAGRVVLETRIHRIARSGRLAVSERRAVELIHAAGMGVVLALLSTPAELRDRTLADEMFAAALRQLLTESPAVADVGPVSAAVALRASVSDLDMLSGGERNLLAEWLDRVSQEHPTRR